MKCYFDTSADGLLNVAIISIADRLFSEKRKWFRLDSGSNDYSLWVLLISKNTRNKNTVTDKENIPSNINESNQINTTTGDSAENEIEEEDIVINGLLKNKNYKEIPTITDTVIMTEMLEHVILPYLVQKRVVSMTSNLLSSPYLHHATHNVTQQLTILIILLSFPRSHPLPLALPLPLVPIHPGSRQICLEFPHLFLYIWMVTIPKPWPW